jgi:hypothetical protein
MEDVNCMINCIITYPVTINAKSKETCTVSNTRKANNYNHTDLTQTYFGENIRPGK